MKILLTVLSLSCFVTLKAQSMKFGHVESALLIESMPESKNIQDSLFAVQNELEDTYQEMQKEYTAKVQNFQESSATWTDSYRGVQEQEIQDLTVRIQSFQKQAQERLSQLQQSLMGPVVEKAKMAIEKVAQEKGLIYVFDYNKDVGIILYKSPASVNILPDVKKALGIQ